MNQEKVAQVALSLVPGVGHLLLKQLIGQFQTAEEVFKASKKQLLNISGMGEKTITSLLQKDKVFEQAEGILKQAEKQQIKIIFLTDPGYPKSLKQIATSPGILYLQGQSEILNYKRRIAIVGTRQATEYGKEVTAKIVEELQPYDALVVSGLAYGIDVAAHRAALQQNLPTIGVLGGAVDKIYPASHRSVAREMLTQGGLLSEYPPGTMPETHFFPARNRIIAGLCEAIIVVEAAEKGGALITADLAFDFDREVFAVPGRVGDSRSEGCLHLIEKQKAHVFTSVKKMAEILNWEAQKQSEKQQSNLQELLKKGELQADEIQLLELLIQHQQGILIDELSWKSQIPINRVASHLLQLEFKGLVKALPGKKFKPAL